MKMRVTTALLAGLALLAPALAADYYVRRPTAGIRKLGPTNTAPLWDTGETLPGQISSLGFAQGFAASDGDDDDLTFAVVGALPGDLQLSGSQVTGTVPDPGTYQFTLSVSDGTATPVERTFSFTATAAANCEILRNTHGVTTSGVYTIDPDGASGIAAFPAWCEMTTHGGGWTLIGHGSTSDSSWTSYTLSSQVGTPDGSGDYFIGVTRYAALVDSLGSVVQASVTGHDQDSGLDWEAGAFSNSALSRTEAGRLPGLCNSYIIRAQSFSVDNGAVITKRYNSTDPAPEPNKGRCGTSAQNYWFDEFGGGAYWRWYGSHDGIYVGAGPNTTDSWFYIRTSPP